MPRIVSGVKEGFEDPGLAFLAGHEASTKRGQEQRAAAMEQMRFGLQIQQAMAKQKDLEAKALEDVNARVQMGDVQAMEQQALEAQAANRPPEQKMYDSMVGAMAHTPDPKARALLRNLTDDYGKQMKRHREMGVATEAIQAGITNGLIPPPKEGEEDEFTKYMKSGGEPEVVMGRLRELDQKQTITNMALQKNAESLAQMEALVQAFPAGDRRLMAEATLEGYRKNIHAQSEPGSGQRALQQLMEDLARGQGQMNADQQALDVKMRQRQASIAGSQADRRKALAGMDEDAKEEFTGRSLTPEQQEQHSARMKAEKEKRYPATQGAPPPPSQGGPEEGYSVAFDSGAAPKAPEVLHKLAAAKVEETRSAEEFMQAMRDSGVDVNDPAQFAIIRQALEARRKSAAPRTRAK